MTSEQMLEASERMTDALFCYIKDKDLDVDLDELILIVQGMAVAFKTIAIAKEIDAEPLSLLKILDLLAKE